MYMFKRSSDGAMIYGDNANSIFQGALWIKPTSGNNVELRNTNGTVFAHEIDITTVKKENGDFYTDINDFNAVSGTFFFRVTSIVDLGTFRFIVSGEALNVEKKVDGQWVLLNAFE